MTTLAAASRIGKLKQRGGATLQALGASLLICLVLGSLGPTIDSRTYPSYGYTGEQAGEVRRMDLDATRRCAAERGENSGWILLTDGAVVCTDKRGHRAKARP